MSIHWYTAWTFCVFALWLASTPKDRVSLRIILIASIVSWVLVDFVTRPIPGAWKLVIPGAVEVATIGALMQWGRNRTAYIQVVLLLVAWLAHIVCWIDVIHGTDYIYSNYDILIQAVAVGQLIACYDTLLSAPARTLAYCRQLRGGGFGGIRTASPSCGVLHRARPPKV